ncbi:polyketide cyclase/dehydrase/lipid transport protein [Paraburkholderia sp. BL21I4N1]|nr:polyketide cyclase/dehydrase/lipid transport protein [Paraburkholderia sp. BL21I4N1]
MVSRLIFHMPATSAEVFEAFHNHDTRLRWDTLLRQATVEGGNRYPHVGALSINVGRGWRGVFCLRTRFIAYDPPHLAAATIDRPAGIFNEWSASIRHRERDDGTSDLIYTFKLSLRPRWIHWLCADRVTTIFEKETQQRFESLAAFLRK